MSTYQVYIGADNNTHLVDMDTLTTVLSRRHAGFTIVKAQGYWQNRPEDSVVVTISDKKKEILSTIETLREELRQEAIAYQHVSPLHFSTGD